MNFGRKKPPDHKFQLHPFSTFCQQIDHQIPEVPDPYYGGEEGFEFVADMLEDGCQQLLEHIREQLA